MTGHEHNHAIALDAVFLIAALFALVAGPLARGATRRGGSLDALIDAFLPIAVIASVTTGVLPESISAIGGWALLAAVVGFGMPALLERAATGAARRGRAALIFVLVALVPHFLIDGFALLTHNHAEADHSGESWAAVALALSVILHQLPFGLFLWNFANASSGKRAAWGALVFSGAVIATGFALAEQVHRFAEGSLAAVLEAFVAGTIAHVVLYHGSFALHSVRSEHPRWRFAGIAAAFALVLAAPQHSHGIGAHALVGIRDVALTVLPFSVPALLLGMIPPMGLLPGRIRQSLAFGLAALVLTPAIGLAAAALVAVVATAAAWAVVDACDGNPGGHTAMALLVGLGLGYLGLAADNVAVGVALIAVAALLAPSPLGPVLVATIAFAGSEPLGLAVAFAFVAAFASPSTVALARGATAGHRVTLAMFVGIAGGLVSSAAVRATSVAPIDLPDFVAWIASMAALLASATALALFGWPAVLPSSLHSDHGELPAFDPCALPPVEQPAAR